MGRLPMAMSMSVAVPVCGDMHVAIPRLVMMVGRHHGVMAMRIRSLSHWHINWRSWGLRGSTRGFMVFALFRERLKLSEGDNRRRSRWVLIPSSWSLSLWSGVKQGSLGLLSPILKCLSPCSVGFECSLG